MTKNALALLGHDLATVTKAFVAQAVAVERASWTEQVSALTARIQELEARPSTVVGPTGPPGEKGADGVGVAGSVISRDGEWVLTFSDGRTCAMGCVVGRDGAPGAKGEPGLNGKDGQDGVGFDDIGFEDDAHGRTYAVFTKGERVIRHRLVSQVYQGIYTPDMHYLKGDAVTWAGAQWTAERDGPYKPGTDESGWRLSVKRGDVGKSGPKGDRGEPGPRGEKGEPGRGY